MDACDLLRRFGNHTLSNHHVTVIFDVMNIPWYTLHSCCLMPFGQMMLLFCCYHRPHVFLTNVASWLLIPLLWYTSPTWFNLYHIQFHCSSIYELCCWVLFELECLLLFCLDFDFVIISKVRPLNLFVAYLFVVHKAECRCWEEPWNHTIS